MKKFLTVFICTLLSIFITDCGMGTDSKQYDSTSETAETGTSVTVEPVTAAMGDSTENYESNLPVIYINTDGSIDITSKDKYIGATAEINTNSDSDQQYSGKIQIRGRGNSSWNEFPKKGYKIKLDKKNRLVRYGEEQGMGLTAGLSG